PMPPWPFSVCCESSFMLCCCMALPYCMLKSLGILPFAILFAITQAAFAQSWPSKPVRIVVAYPPGGGIDVMARQIAEKLTGSWGQPVVVENKPGANTILATDAVAKSPADGYTILMTT